MEQYVNWAEHDVTMSNGDKNKIMTMLREIDGILERYPSHYAGHEDVVTCMSRIKSDVKSAIRWTDLVKTNG